jgi:hypothetical protein
MAGVPRIAAAFAALHKSAALGHLRTHAAQHWIIGPETLAQIANAGIQK